MPISESIEVARPPADVFAYIDQVDKHPEWQADLVSVEQESDGPPAVGTTFKETRNVPGGARTFRYQLTEHDPPNRLTFKGLDGPLRPNGTVTLTPLADGARTRLQIDFDLEPHGLGYLLAFLARKNARRTIPRDLQSLKQRLESGS